MTDITDDYNEAIVAWMRGIGKDGPDGNYDYDGIMVSSTDDGSYVESDDPDSNKIFKDMGIFPEKFYPKGIVTITHNDTGIYFEAGKISTLYLVAWKIDDVAWIIGTTGQSHIMPDDVDAIDGVDCFALSHFSAWDNGYFVFNDSCEAYKMVERIKKLTQHYGLDIQIVSRHLTRID